MFVICLIPSSEQSLMDTLMTPITWVMKAASKVAPDSTTKSIADVINDEIEEVPETQPPIDLSPTTLPPSTDPLMEIQSSTISTLSSSLPPSRLTSTTTPTTTSTATSTTTPATTSRVTTTATRSIITTTMSTSPVTDPMHNDPALTLIKILANLTTTGLDTRTARQEGYDYEIPQPVYNPADTDEDTENDEYRPHFQFHSELAKALGVHHDNRKVIPNRS